MLWQPRWQREGAAPRRGRWLEPVAGGALGFLAGVVGIGGGIFLAPLLYMLRWGSERAIAGTCALFILVNSLAGLAGQLAKDDARVAAALADHWPLVPGGARRRADRRRCSAASGFDPEACPARHRPARPLCRGAVVAALV